MCLRHGRPLIRVERHDPHFLNAPHPSLIGVPGHGTPPISQPSSRFSVSHPRSRPPVQPAARSGQARGCRRADTGTGRRARHLAWPRRAATITGLASDFGETGSASVAEFAERHASNGRLLRLLVTDVGQVPSRGYAGVVDGSRPATGARRPMWRPAGGSSTTQLAQLLATTPARPTYVSPQLLAYTRLTGESTDRVAFRATKLAQVTTAKEGESPSHRNAWPNALIGQCPSFGHCPRSSSG